MNGNQDTEIQERFTSKIRNPEKCLLVESGILLFGIWNPSFGILNTGKETFSNLESIEVDVEFSTSDPEYTNTVSITFTWGEASFRRIELKT